MSVDGEMTEAEQDAFVETVRSAGGPTDWLIAQMLLPEEERADPQLLGEVAQLIAVQQLLDRVPDLPEETAFEAVSNLEYVHITLTGNPDGSTSLNVRIDNGEYDDCEDEDKDEA